MNLNLSTLKQKRCVKALIVSILFSAVMLFIFLYFSIYSSFNPDVHDSKVSIDSFYNPNNRFANIHADTLYYSGYIFSSHNNIKGYYYYSLSEKQCTIYLISKNYIKSKNLSEATDIPPAKLNNVSFLAVLKKNDDNLKPLLESMASDLNWNYSGLSKSTSDILISQYHYCLPFYITITLLLFAGMISNVILVTYIYIRRDEIK